MRLDDFWRALSRHYISFLIVLLFTVSAVWAVTMVLPKKYEANIQIIVSVLATENVAEMNQGNVFSQDRVGSYAELVKTSSVLEPVVQQMGSMSLDEIRSSITAQSPAATFLINVSATTTDPETTKQLVDLVGESLIEVVERTENIGEINRVNLSVVNESRVPTQPSSPKLVTNLILGIILGIALGTLVAMLRESFSGKKTLSEDIVDKLGISNTAVLVSEKKHNKPILDPNDPYTEDVKQLAARILAFEPESQCNTVSFTACAPGQGNSTLITDVAATLAETGKRVLVIYANLHSQQSAENVFNVGVASICTGSVFWQHGITFDPKIGCDIMGPGKVDRNPSLVLTEKNINNLINIIKFNYDVVLFDCPPVLWATEAVNIASQTESVILSVSAKMQDSDRRVTKALDLLESVGARTICIAINNLSKRRMKSKSKAYEDGLKFPQVTSPNFK